MSYERHEEASAPMPPMPSMPPESAPGSAGLDHPGVRPDDSWPADEPLDELRGEPDPDWPDDWPDDDQGGPSWPGIPPPARGGGGIPGRRPLALAAVAVVALAAGAGVALILGQGPSSAPSAAANRPSSPAVPSSGAPGRNSNGGVLPGGGGGGTVQMFVGGQVLAVSGTSITLGGPDHTVTAAVTSRTHVTGRVSSIRSVKVGDLVTAQITQSGGHATVTAIQDPAQLPSGSSLP
jgi:hypothetical protein